MVNFHSYVSLPEGNRTNGDTMGIFHDIMIARKTVLSSIDYWENTFVKGRFNGKFIEGHGST
jgi:hypothetical protein